MLADRRRGGYNNSNSWNLELALQGLIPENDDDDEDDDDN